MKAVLLVAYHFPPVAGSSGVQRTLRFAQHLPELGWQPIVLTAHPRAYERTARDLLGEIPVNTPVVRAIAFDTARHFSLAGRYPGLLAIPDRWVSWLPGAVAAGLAMIRRYRPQVIWSTYPIATAHIIGAVLHRISGIPWIADFRDPMAQDGYPPDPRVWRSYQRVEEHATSRAAFCTFTTPGTARLYRARYPEASERMVLLENGYDEESFVAVESTSPARPPLNPGAFTLLHSGIVYPSERDPTQLLTALARLAQSGRIQPGRFMLRLRAPEHVALLDELVARHGVARFVEICPPLGYRDALHEMLCADALLVMQGANCNNQIPAKVYEYLRAQRPIVCLSDPSGDTAAILRQAGVRSFARLNSADEIAGLLPDVVDRVRDAVEPVPSSSAVRGASRRGRAQELAGVLDEARMTAGHS